MLSVDSRFVKYLLLLPLLLVCALRPASAGDKVKDQKPFVIYMQFTEDTPVDLADGSHWMMDKGDCFPVYMFKEQGTKVVLQLAGTTFMTEAYRMRNVKDEEKDAAMESYRKMVDSYLKTQTDKWKKDVKK